MMTEKEYETLKEKRDKAKRFMDYCLDTAASIQEGINGATDFGYYGLTTDDMITEKTDLDMMRIFTRCAAVSEKLSLKLQETAKALSNLKLCLKEPPVWGKWTMRYCPCTLRE